jgi:hypothetical protein
MRAASSWPGGSGRIEIADLATETTKLVVVAIFIRRSISQAYFIALSHCKAVFTSLAS